MGAGFAAAKRGKEPAFARYFSKNEEHHVFRLISCMKDKFLDRGVFVHFQQSEVCGAVAIDADFAFARVRQLLSVDGNGVNMLAENREDGFMLDFNPDDYEGCYELVVWGATWPVWFLACL